MEASDCGFFAVSLRRMTKATSESFPFILNRHYSHSTLPIRSPDPFAISTTNAYVSLSSLARLQLAPIHISHVTCAFPKLSESPCWKGLSEEKKQGFSKFFEELRMEALEFQRAQLKAEAKERLANKRRELAQQELVCLRDRFEPELQLREKHLLQKLRNAMKTRTRIAVDAEGLSFDRLIYDVERTRLSTNDYTLRFRDRWILICSQYPSFFEKLKSCNHLWETEADVAGAVYSMCSKTTCFRHSFKEVDGLICMDLPPEIATEEKKKLAGVIAEEAGFILGFYAANVP